MDLYEFNITIALKKGGEDLGLFSKKIFFLKFKKNDLYGGNFMREIDSAHFRILKMLPWFREMSVLYWSENQTFSNFYEKTVDS